MNVPLRGVRGMLLHPRLYIFHCQAAAIAARQQDRATAGVY